MRNDKSVGLASISTPASARFGLSAFGTGTDIFSTVTPTSLLDVGSLETLLRSFSAQTLIDGFKNLTESLQAVFQDLATQAGKIPVIGDKLLTATDSLMTGLQGLQEKFIEGVTAAFAAAQADPNANLANALQDAFYAAFGPSGMKMLKDGSDAGNDISSADIVRVAGSANGDFVEWQMLLGQNYTLIVPFEGFDLSNIDGLQGVNLNIASPNGIEIKVKWEFRLGFGLTTEPHPGDFYLKSDAVDALKAGAPTPELKLSIAANAAPQKDALGNLTVTTEPGLQGEIDLGVLHATVSDGTTTRIKVSGDPFITVGDAVSLHDYSGSFSLTLQDTVRGVHTYNINYSGHGSETLAGFLLNLNSQINSALQSNGYSTAYPPVVVTADAEVLNGAVTPSTNSYINDGGPGGPALIFTATTPDITNMTLTGAEEYGMNPVQFEDSRAIALGFEPGQSSAAGVPLEAQLPAPGSGALLKQDVNFILQVGTKNVRVAMNAILNRDITSLAELQSRVTETLSNALSQAGLSPTAVTVTLNGNKLVFNSASALQVIYNRQDTTSFELIFSVDFKDPNFVLANVDPDNQLTYSRLSLTEINAASAPSAVMTPVLAGKAKVRLHVNSDRQTLSNYAEQALGAAGGSLGLPTVAFDLKLDASVVVDFSKPSGERVKKGLDSLIFDNVVMDAGSLLNLVLKPVANIFGTSLGPILDIIGSSAGATNGFLNQPIKLLQRLAWVTTPSWIWRPVCRVAAQLSSAPSLMPSLRWRPSPRISPISSLPMMASRSASAASSMWTKSRVCQCQVTWSRWKWPAC